MSQIPISREHGLNPTIEICARCGKDTGSLLIPGRISLYRCSACGADNIYLRSRLHNCPKCDKGTLVLVKADVQMPRKVNTGNICKDCREEEKKHLKIVEAGGIYWKCVDCKSEGVITAEAKLSKHIREVLKVEPPKPCGVELSKEKGCPACNKKEEG